MFYSFIILWSFLRKFRCKFVQQNLPKMSTVFFCFCLLTLNLMYRGYVNLGGAVVTSSHNNIMFLVFFSCTNNNSIVWSVCVESPLVLLLQYWLYQVQSELSPTSNCRLNMSADETASAQMPPFALVMCLLLAHHWQIQYNMAKQVMK